jgi:2-polyprenyl-3-methyl-5-hydroxy-6-metoxy-1,4-benzoquinol methylase
MECSEHRGGIRTVGAKCRAHDVRRGELKRSMGWRALDIGCGAGRNAIPLARLGWNVVGTDLSWPLLCAAANRTTDCT